MQEMILEMKQRLEGLRVELNKAQAEADAKNIYVEELERQQSALQSALDILEGRAPTAAPAPSVLASALQIPKPGIERGAVIQMPSLQGKKVTLNGDEIILEPGMRVGHNSYGEEVLLPEGTPDPPLMAEPFVPLKGSVSLPPITDADRFDDPKDML